MPVGNDFSSMITVIRALPEDALAICDVLKRSILELCIADHKHDPSILARWLRNKTRESVMAEMVQPGHLMLVAVDASVTVGVGLVSDAGEIHLNYVSPEARFRGVSRKLMFAMETYASECGNARCTLTSTETARRFYRSSGYIEEGEVVLRFPGDCPGYKMSKPLTKDFVNNSEKE